jgi:hypothetical protein
MQIQSPRVSRGGPPEPCGERLERVAVRAGGGHPCTNSGHPERERGITSHRRECLDFLIPLAENDLHITIEVGPTLVSGQPSRIRQLSFVTNHIDIGIGFRATVHLWLILSLADYTTNIAW